MIFFPFESCFAMQQYHQSWKATDREQQYVGYADALIGDKRR